jgi:predicted MFS family arabinose efflux permease
MHGIGGNLGYALAPVVSFALGAAFGWRTALGAMGAIGFVALAFVAAQRALLVSQRAVDAHLQTLKGSFALFAQPSIALCFAYFVIQTTATVGLQTFTPSALVVGFDVPLALATSAVTAYLLGGTAGILGGGFLAARTARHDRVATVGLLAAMLLLLGIASGGLPQAGLLPLFALTGFALGVTGPSRDLIVRNATPKGAAGRVYGFVYSGLDLGATLGPIWFGLLLDQGRGREMFFAIAGCMLLAVGTVVQVRRATAVRTV